MVKNIRVLLGKKNPDGTKKDRSTPPVAGVPFKKQSIFFQYMPYWADLEIPHSIDAMHMQKNVFENLIATLMVTGKSKDGLKARKDMVQLNVMPQLHPVPKANGKYTLPAACFNLTPDDKRAICTFLRGIKVPTGFSANVKKLVSMKDLSITHRLHERLVGQGLQSGARRPVKCSSLQSLPNESGSAFSPEHPDRSM